MPLVINTNVSSLNSQRQLVKSGMELDQSMERLSSGKRVNNAADDAAGLAIANRMTSQIRGLNQAIRNANDGVSMIQTAEGALDETTNILQRMRELSIQAANGIYSDADRSTLDAEVQQLKQELDRIAESTTFNGQPLLDGSQKDVTLQVGSEATDTIAYSISAMDTDTLGGGNSADIVGAEMGLSAQALGAAIATGQSTTVSFNGQSVGDLSSVDDMNGLLEAMNAAVSGVEISAFVEAVSSADGDGVLRGTDTLTLTMVDNDGEDQVYIITNTGSMNELVDKINETTGNVIKASLNDDGRLELTTTAGESISVAETRAASGLDTAAAHRAQFALEVTDTSIENVDVAITGTAGSTEGTQFNNLIQNLGLQPRTDTDITGTLMTGTGALTEGHLILNDIAISGATPAGATSSQKADAIIAAINAKSDEHGIVASAVAASAAGQAIKLDSVDGTEIKVDFAGATATFANLGFLETNVSNTVGDSISSVDISTADGAQDALDVIDAALETINAIRADLGAVNNRLEFTMSNLANVVENTEASRSRIMDADFAAESAALSRAQVLQQASQAMLAQANARPQQVLQLLQG